jgi:tetratricopeptide (TPR) repeat protein
MDEQRFLHACQLRDEGKLAEAYDEFSHLAETATDPLDKAGALLYAANTLEMFGLGQVEAATNKLSEARTLIEQYLPSKSLGDEKFAVLELFLDYEDANLFWLRSQDHEVALNRFDAVLKKHRLEATLRKDSLTPKDRHAHDFAESIQIRRAFILADLGHWKEALPILEAIESPQEFREGVAFYLGHCYSSAQALDKAEQKLTEALKLGLPRQLECCAHCELGATYYNLKDYAKAKEEFEKGAQMADATYIKESQIWRWLELTCRALGQKAEAEQYARMSRPS